MDDEFPEEDLHLPRRSLRIALSEVNESSSSDEGTPNKNANPEEALIAQRGRRSKPLTWSPVDYKGVPIFTEPRNKTPEPQPLLKSEMNPRLKRRLIMSPEKNSSRDLGLIIARKLKALNKLGSV